MKNQIAQIAPKQIRYKLTTQSLTTRNGFQWEIGKTEKTDGSGELCSSGWLHCYTNPLLAILLNPVHANISSPRLFEVEVSGSSKTDNGLKEGWTGMELIKEIKIPNITITQKVAFGILCSLEVYKEKSYVVWANNWLNNVDRTELAADADAAAAADWAASARAAADWAARAADWAADAAIAEINLIQIAEKAMKIS